MHSPAILVGSNHWPEKTATDCTAYSGWRESAGKFPAPPIIVNSDLQVGVATNATQPQVPGNADTIP